MLLINSYIYYSYNVDSKFSQKKYRVDLIRDIRARHLEKRMSYSPLFASPKMRSRYSNMRSSSLENRTILNRVTCDRDDRDRVLLATIDCKYPMRLVNVGQHLVESIKSKKGTTTSVVMMYSKSKVKLSHIACHSR